MTVLSENPWLISYQIGWEQYIFNVEMPMWFRVYAVAMARSEANLHTLLQPGELAALLGKSQPDGTLKAADPSNLNKFIRTAIRYGLLDKSSNARCLVLPTRTTDCRRRGQHKPCPQHTGHSTKPKKPITLKQPAEQSSESRALSENKSNDASPQVGAWPLVLQVPKTGTSVTTPGSRDIFGAKPLHRYESKELV